MAQQAGQPGGVVRVVLQQQPGVGGIDLQPVHIDLLSVQLHPLLHRPDLAGSGESRVQRDLEAEAGGGRAVPVGVDGELQVQTVRYLLLSVVQYDVSGVLWSVHTVRQDGGPGREASAVHIDHGVFTAGILPGQGIKEVYLLLVHDQVLQREGIAAVALGLVHLLHPVVLHCGGQAVGEAHRLGQPAQHGDVGAGLSEGGADIDQQDKDRRRRGQGAQGPQPPAAGPPPLQGPVQGPIQGGGRLPELLGQGIIFLLPVHGHTSSHSSRRSRARAFRWRVDTVPGGRERISAVSARV